MYGAALVKGLLVTFKNLTKRPFTIQYPEQRVPQHPRFRGEEFVWYEERCTGCASCAKYCPLGIIKIVTAPSGTAPMEGDKYRLEVFDIDIARCMFCGLCVEACPYDALFMGSGFEQGQYSRKDMVITLDQLRGAEKQPSSFFRLQLEKAGYDPHAGQPLDWKQVGRESWRWHQQEKAGMRLSPVQLPIQPEIQPIEATDPPSTPLSGKVGNDANDDRNGAADPASPEEAG